MARSAKTVSLSPPLCDNDEAEYEDDDQTNVKDFLRVAMPEPHFNETNRSLCEEKFTSEAINTLGKVPHKSD